MVKVDIFSLFHILRVKCSVFSWFIMMPVAGFYRCPLSGCRSHFLLLGCSELLSWINILLWQLFFPEFIEITMCFSFLYSINIVCYVNRVLNVKPILHFGDKYHLFILYISFNMVIYFASALLRISVLMFLMNIDFQFSVLVVYLSFFHISVMLT